MAEFESVVDYSTKLDNFEGPLDLLLHLIKEAKIEIKDVFVSQVTEQFLAYMNGVESLDVDKASEYLNMAATLLEIKSKSILPRVEDFMDDIEDPEAVLIRQLEEYKLFKEASSKLKEQENVLRFYKEPDKSVGDVKVVYNDFNLDGLIAAFSKLYKLGTQLELSCDTEGLYAVAATNGKKTVAVISNISGSAHTLSIEGVDLSDAHFYVLDQERLLSWAPNASIIENNAVVMIEI